VGDDVTSWRPSCGRDKVVVTKRSWSAGCRRRRGRRVRSGSRHPAARSPRHVRTGWLDRGTCSAGHVEVCVIRNLSPGLGGSCRWTAFVSQVRARSRTLVRGVVGGHGSLPNAGRVTSRRRCSPALTVTKWVEAPWPCEIIPSRCWAGTGSPRNPRTRGEDERGGERTGVGAPSMNHGLPSEKDHAGVGAPAHRVGEPDASRMRPGGPRVARSWCTS